MARRKNCNLCFKVYTPGASDDDEPATMEADHIGPIDGLNFMSLNMNDDQLAVVSRAIAAAFERVRCPHPSSTEEALTYIWQ